jgi:PEP-CTERM motif
MVFGLGRAMAGPITYTFSGTFGDGTIGGSTSLTGVDFVITVTSDTSGVTSSATGIGTELTTQSNQPALITLNGIGTATLPDGVTVWDVQTISGIPALGIDVGPTQVTWFQLGNPASGNYHLTTTIGPITGGAGSGLDYVPVPTSLGDILSNEWEGVCPSFSAQLTGSAVPEPSSLALAASAGILAARTWRRKRCRR